MELICLKSNGTDIKECIDELKNVVKEYAIIRPATAKSALKVLVHFALSSLTISERYIKVILYN